MNSFKFVLVLMTCLIISQKSISQDCLQCESLLEEMKSDPLFVSYLSISKTMIDIYKSNYNEQTYDPILDSTIMSDSTMSIVEKYTALGYKGARLLDLLYEKLLIMHGKLEDKYPEFRGLTEDEQDKFNELAILYYNTLKE